MKYSLSIIIVTYNNQHQIADCLQSVFKNVENLNDDLNYNLTILDNNSRDETLNVINKISTSDKNISVLENKKNLGFAKAVNQGIKFAQQKFDSDFYFLLNPDAILKDDCLKKMYVPESNSWQHQELNSRVTSPLIINPKNNQPWFSGAKINWLKFKTEHICREQACLFSTEKEKPRTDYLTGCALLIPKQVIKKTGFFDEIFFLYYEDADFSLRAKKAGFDLKIIPEAICYHEESQSSTSKIKDYYLVKSGLIFFHKHYPVGNRHACSLHFWIAFYLRLFYHKFFSHKKEVIQAMKDFKKDK
jgi:GT2 family glycosyltransferase